MPRPRPPRPPSPAPSPLFPSTSRLSCSWGYLFSFFSNVSDNVVHLLRTASPTTSCTCCGQLLRQRRAPFLFCFNFFIGTAGMLLFFHSQNCFHSRIVSTFFWMSSFSTCRIVSLNRTVDSFAIAPPTSFLRGWTMRRTTGAIANEINCK